MQPESSVKAMLMVSLCSFWMPVSFLHMGQSDMGALMAISGCAARVERSWHAHVVSITRSNRHCPLDNPKISLYTL